MPTVSFHGVPIDWITEPPARDPLGELLAMLAPQATDAPARIHISFHPATPDAALDPRDDGAIPSFFHGVVQAYRAPSGFLLWDRASRVALSPDGTCIHAQIADSAREITPGSAAVMMQIALVLALRHHGLFHLHAAALESPSGATLLLAGGSGAGKTTAALALLEAGFAYLGDDTALLGRELSTQNPTLFAFPRAFHLGPATLSAFPRLLPFVSQGPAPRDKRPLDPRLAFPDRLKSALHAPRLALFPEITHAPESALQPIPKADAFGRLVGASAGLLIDDAPQRDQNLALLRQILDNARCFALHLGADLLAAPSATLAPLVAHALDDHTP